jgi:hypothetical protein
MHLVCIDPSIINASSGCRSNVEVSYHRHQPTSQCEQLGTVPHQPVGDSSSPLTPTCDVRARPPLLNTRKLYSQ